MITTENDYHLLSELISMDNRHLAQKVELLVWDEFGNIRQNIWTKFVNCCRDSKTQIEFQTIDLPKLVEQIASQNNIIFSTMKHRDCVPCKMDGNDVVVSIEFNICT